MKSYSFRRLIPILAIFGFVLLVSLSAGAQLIDASLLDPASVDAQTTLYATADAWVNAAAPDTTYGTYNELSAGQINHHYRHILVRFDLSSVPAGSSISAAYLEMQTIINMQALTGEGNQDSVLELHAARLDDRWRETEVTWRNQPDATDLNDPPTDVHTGEMWKRIDVTRIMRSLITQGDRNFGILVSGDGVSEGAMSFFAREHGNDSRPRLRIQYTAPTQTPTPTATPGAGVPLDAQRRAAQHLEDVRDTDAAPTWRHAVLGEPVRPLYRPDIHGPAYYEFPMVDASNQSPLGFIIVSTGDHDYPIPHWAYAGIPITQQLEQLAAKNEKQAVKFYKLDALAYAAENEAGERVAIRGDQPFKITGMDPAWLDNPPGVAEAEWRPDMALVDDEHADQITGTYTVTGPTPPPNLHFSAWKSWDDLKAGYHDSYGVLTESLHRNASELWTAESAVRDYGHPLHKDETVIVPLLFSGPRVTLSGKGASDVRSRVISRTGLPPQLQVTVLRVVPGAAIPLAANVSYGSGASETINFLIVDPYRTFLPLVDQGASPMAGATQGGEAHLGAQGVERIQAGPWHNYYAGTYADQCRYIQIPKYESPNTSSCPSGCGATAWSMLFGWIDNQAAPDSGNDYWNGRWGLFRMNGQDKIAPKIWTIEDYRFSALKDMTWEIHNDIDTWCSGDSGPTAPWDMNGVKSYVSGRSAVRVYTKYSNVGIGWDYIRDYAKNSIAYSGEGKHTPAIVGTGLLAHYPLAYGYRWRDHTYCILGWCWTSTERQFLVNQGWGQDHGEWIASDVWFAGRLFPHAVKNDDVGLYGVYSGDWYFDYDHNGDTDEFREHTSLTPGFPLAGDFNRDHILGDIAVYDPVNKEWTYDYKHDRTGDGTSQWGYEDGKPFALDLDCDGFVDDVGLYKDSNHNWFYADHTLDHPTYTSGPWGSSGDMPVAGDFDRDGCVDDVARFHIGPSGGGWIYDYNHNGDTDYTFWTWGESGDRPVAGDFDNDGLMDDVGVFRPSTKKWYFDYDHDGTTNLVSGPWGYAGSLPVAGNFETK